MTKKRTRKPDRRAMSASFAESIAAAYQARLNRRTAAAAVKENDNASS